MFAVCISVLVYVLVTWMGRDLLKENQRRKQRLKEDKKREKIELNQNGDKKAPKAKEEEEEEEEPDAEKPLALDQGE